MNDPKARQIYAQKLISAKSAAALLKSGDNISMGMALGEPPALLSALSNRLDTENLTGLKLWYFHSMPRAATTLLQYKHMEKIRPYCMFLGPTERALEKQGQQSGHKVVDFVPVAFSQAPALLTQDRHMDVFITVVSPMDRHGFFSLGTNNDYASAVSRAAGKTVVEVNKHMPRVFGESMIHVSEVAAIVENDTPLAEHTPKSASAEQEKIARTIAEIIPDGACLQMGIGALPSVVCDYLKDHKDLGIHTELLTPGLTNLIKCGAVNNRRKQTYPGRSVFTFALGDKALFDHLDDNPSICSLPVNIVNDPRHIAKNDNVYSINCTLEVDLFGACNSENISGVQYSGSGGQLDFVRGARASKGGRSIIACTSTAKNGTISRIVPKLSGPVTTPRNDVDMIVTEYGAAELIGLSGEERARALITLAHPKFREELEQSAIKFGFM